MKGKGWTFDKFTVVEAPRNESKCVDYNCGISVIKGMQAAYNAHNLCIHVRKEIISYLFVVQLNFVILNDFFYFFFKLGEPYLFIFLLNLSGNPNDERDCVALQITTSAENKIRSSLVKRARIFEDGVLASMVIVSYKFDIFFKQIIVRCWLLKFIIKYFERYRHNVGFCGKLKEFDL